MNTQNLALLDEIQFHDENHNSGHLEIEHCTSQHMHTLDVTFFSNGCWEASGHKAIREYQMPPVSKSSQHRRSYRVLGINALSVSIPGFLDEILIEAAEQASVL